MRLQEIQLSLFPKEEIDEIKPKQKVVNVASVPKRSPFRYPGGKTWLVPTVRKWFAKSGDNSVLIEPFAGGGIISLTAIAEHYFNRAIMVELDEDMASAWRTMLSDDCDWLMNQISSFQVSADNINRVVELANNGVKERAFATIVRNRTNHGGILARGSGKIKSGENGKGLASRWYPSTLNKRIAQVNKMKDDIIFIQGDAFDVINNYLDDANVFFFIDPPYTVAGRRLYNHYEIDHHRLFELVKQMKGQYLMTYDNSDEVKKWAIEFGMEFLTIPMQTTHLITKEELLISNDFSWI